VGGIVVGSYLDKIFHTHPWLTIIFFIGGIASGVNIALFIIRKYKKE
jgi:F0F1-type ATP synthase assembly protein I